MSSTGTTSWGPSALPGTEKCHDLTPDSGWNWVRRNGRVRSRPPQPSDHARPLPPPQRLPKALPRLDAAPGCKTCVQFVPSGEFPYRERNEAACASRRRIAGTRCGLWMTASCTSSSRTSCPSIAVTSGSCASGSAASCLGKQAVGGFERRSACCRRMGSMDCPVRSPFGGRT